MFKQVTPRQVHTQSFSLRGGTDLEDSYNSFFIKKLCCKNHTINITVTTLFAVAIYIYK